FGGSRTAYWAAVRAAKLTLGDARAIIAARLERDDVEEHLKAPSPTHAAVVDFLATYKDEQARLVTTTQKAPVLGGPTRGRAIESLAPAEVFSLAGSGKIETADGTFDVTQATPTLPLGLLPKAQAAAAAAEALGSLERESEYRAWLRTQEKTLLGSAQCLNDQ